MWFGKVEGKLSLYFTNSALCHEGVWGVDALAGGERSASHPCCCTLGERAPGTHSMGGWVGPRASLDDMEKQKFLTLPGLELRPLGHPARSQPLYQLRCPGSRVVWWAPIYPRKLLLHLQGICSNKFYQKSL
jgi:hypothetical protein